MTSFSQPLVPLCLSKEDDSLLDYAAHLARWLRWGELHFAHIVDVHDRGAEWNPAPCQERIRRHVRHYLADGPRLSFHALAGTVQDEILRLVVEQERDLILLGHRKSRSGRRSLARRLAMVSPASVWLVPEGAPPQITGILVPVDFSSHSADALSVAVDIARAVGLDRLRVVHVFFDLSTVRYDEHVDEILGQEETAFERFMEGIDAAGVDIEPVFVEGTKPAQDILRIAEHAHSDLIVMSTRGRSRAASVLLGSTTSAAMAAATVPILAVKHFGDRLTLREALVNHRIWEQPSPKTN
jgi:nucleotide-binding universal stress UspA family protein